MDIGTLMVLLKATDSMSPVMRQAAQSVDQLAPSVQAASRSSTQAFNSVGNSAKQASTQVSGASKNMQTAMGGLTDSLSPVPLGMAGVGIAAGLMAKSTFTAASDMSENINKVNVVFGKSSAEIRDWADDAATNLGLSESAALSAAGTFGNMLTAMGMTGSAASDMSRGIVQLAADLGSFNNIGTAEALEKIRAGLVGETEPLRSLGVNLNAAAIQAKALELGLAGTATELTAADKAQASYALILEQTTNAQGDFARTADGAANSLKTLQATSSDAAAAIGTVLVPLVADFARETNESARAILTLVEAADRLRGGGGDDGGGSGFSLGDALKSVPITKSIIDANNALKDLAATVDDTAESGATLVDVIRNTEQSLRDATEPATIFEQVVAAMREEFNRTRTDGQELIDLLARMTNEAETGGESLGKSGRSIAEISQQARIGKGELIEFANSSEMVSDSVARANQNLAYMGEASRLALQGQKNLNTAWGDANTAVSFWEQNLSNAEKALAILDGEMEENGKLTVEQQRAYDLLTEATGRYKGGVEDTEGAVVDAAVAQFDFIKKQDELKGLLDSNTITASEYARQMAGITAETDPAASSTYNLTAAQGDLVTAIGGVVDKVIDLLVKLGLIPAEKKTDISTPGADDAKQKVHDLGEGIGALPSSFTVTAYANIAPAMEGIQQLRNNMPSSPAKEGPFRVLPTWEGVFDGLGVQAELWGSLSAKRVAGYFPMTGVTSGALRQTADWSFLFVDLDAAAEDFGEQAGQKFIQFFQGNIEALASGEMLADAQAKLDELLTIKQIALDSGVTGQVIMQINQEIQAQQDAIFAIGAAMGTDIVQGISDALKNGEVSAALADFREDVISGLDLGSILGDQEDLNTALSQLLTLQQAALELGDIETANRLAEDIARLTAEVALANQVIGTDAVQAWLAWQEEVEAAAEAAEALKQKHEDLIQSYYDAITAISQGGDATSDYLTGLVEDYEAAKEALRWGELLGLPPEVLEQLRADLDEAGQLLETGSVYLVKALREGLIDEATLQSLAEAGGEWFQAIYDSIFGEGALAQVQSGWNDIDQITIERLAQLAGLMEDGGAEVIGPLIDAIAAGAISYEDALGLLSEATGEQVNIMIDELERLQAALIVQLAEAFLAGTDPTGIEANLAIIEQLLASLADRAVETANVVVQAGKSMAMGYKAAADEMAAVNASTAAATSTSSGGPLGYNNNPGLNSMDRDGDGIVDGSRRGYSSRSDPNRPGAPRTAANGPRDYYEGSRLSQEELRGIRDAVRAGAAAGTSSGFSGWQPPLGGR